MSVTSIDRLVPLRVIGTVTLVAVLVIAAALAGRVEPMVALAVAAGGGALPPAAALVWRGLAVRTQVHSMKPLRGACRCVGLLGLGVLAGGLTAAAIPLVAPAQRQALAAGGLAVSAVLFATGLLYTPGVATGAAARLRYGLDALVTGVCLALVGWLLVPGVRDGQAWSYVAAVIAATYAAVSTATMLRTSRQRAATLRCGSGTGLAVIGMAMLVVAVGPEVPRWAVLLAAGLVVAAPPLVWAGVGRVNLAPPAREPGNPGSFEGYPVLALPVAAAVLAAAYHVLVVGQPDLTAVLLAMGGGAVLAVREVLAASELRRYAGRLMHQEARLRALVAGASDVTMMLDDDLVVHWQSPAAAHQLGLAEAQVVGRRFTDLLHPDDAVPVADRLRTVVAGQVTGESVLLEARLVDGRGEFRETESTVSDLRRTPEVGALVVQVRDVGHRRYLERTLQRLVSTDQRTGLPNRRELLRAISARRGAGHRRRPGALLVLELYGLSAIHDLRGSAAAEAALTEAARRLQAESGQDDLVGRLGESQFGVVTADGPIEAYSLGARLLAVLNEPYPLPDRPVRLRASVGLAALAAGTDADDVVRRARLALRQASQPGGGKIEWYDESLEEQLVRRLDLERHLPGASGRGELDLVYQPVLELAGGRPVGVEALLRWRHPVLGTVLPGEFLPVAEKLQVTSEIAEWVLHAACQQAAAWRRDGHDMWLAVNVSASQLSGEFVPEVAAALSVHQMPPERLTIEISESELSEPAAVPVVAGQLGKLRGLGVRTALDDFGTGSTDPAGLRRLPLDLVKVFTPQLGGRVAAVVELATRLGLTVVAEGVETEAHRELVTAAGCRYAQGFLLGPPAPVEHVAAYLDRTTSSR